MSYALLALSYLLGSMPTSYVIGKYFHGIDLREHGSGNLGATNAFRVLGVRSAIPVVLVDIAKGFVPAWYFPRLVGSGLGWTLAFGAAAILGYAFSSVDESIWKGLSWNVTAKFVFDGVLYGLATGAAFAWLWP